MANKKICDLTKKTPASVNDLQGLVIPVADCVNNSNCGIGAADLVNLASGGSDKNVSVSASDTISGFLDDKLNILANAGLGKSVNNAGNNEVLQLGINCGNLLDFNDIAGVDAANDKLLICNASDGVNAAPTLVAASEFLGDDQVAAEVPYVNTTSGLVASDVQSAIDEVVGGLQPEFEFRLSGQSGTTGGNTNRPQSTTDTIEREGDASFGENYPSSGNLGKLNVVPSVGQDAALVVGRPSGKPNVTSNDNFLLFDSPGTGGFAGVNYYGGDDFIVNYGGGRVGVGTNNPGSGNSSYFRIISPNAGDRTLHAMGAAGQTNNIVDIENNVGQSGFVLDHLMRASYGQPSINPVTPTLGVIDVSDIIAGSAISIEPNTNGEDITSFSTTDIDNGTMLFIRGSASNNEAVLRSGVGNLELQGDMVMRKEDTIMLMYEGGIWREMSRSRNQVLNEETSRKFTILAMGQSNMVGRDNSFSGTYDVTRKISAWDDVNNKWVAAQVGQEPFLEGTTTNSTNFALEFARRFEEKKGHLYDEIRIIFSAQGATSINQWVGSGTSSTMYADAMSQVANAGVNEIDVVLFHQGEADEDGSGTGYDTAATYEAALDTLVTQLRAEPQIANTVPIIFGELAPALEGGIMADRNDVITTKFNDGDNWTGYADATGTTLLPDNVHFDTSSIITLGRERYWQAYLTLAYNNTEEDTTTPAYPNMGVATITSISSNEVPLPNTSRFIRVKAETGTADSIDRLTPNGHNDGDIIVLVGTGGHTLTLNNNAGGVGHLWMNGSTSHILNSSVDTITFIKNGSQWIEIARSNP